MPESTEIDRPAIESLARAALHEVTTPKHVGALREIEVADEVATVRFSTTQGGYPGWAWTVSVAVNPGMEPAVLETELMPGDGALVAPDWVPWSDRLEDYLAQQAETGEDASEDDDESDDDADDEDDDDHPELDDDVDGVDIDLHADGESDVDDDDHDDDDDDDESDDDDDESDDEDDFDEDRDDDDDDDDLDDEDDDSGL